MTANELPAPEPIIEAKNLPLVNQKAVPTSRLTMIDVAKGVGILLIVFGHDPYFGPRLPELQETLRGIRMPFFFFLSGVTFSMGNRSLGQLAFLRADAWLKPYVLTALIFGLMNIYLDQTATFESVAVGIIFGTGFTVSPTALWFLPHLWLLYISAGALLISAKSIFAHPAVRILVVVAMLTAGSFITDNFDSRPDNPLRWLPTGFDERLFSLGFPFSADLLPITLAYFLMGNFLSQQAKQYRFNLVHAGIAALIIVALRCGLDHSMDLNYRRYDHIVTTTMLAIAGIYLFLAVSSLLSTIKHVSDTLIFIGRGSLFILLFHMPMLYKLPLLLGQFVRLSFPWYVLIFFMSVVGPLILWQVAKRYRLTRLLFLPALRLSKKSPVSESARAGAV